MSDAQQNLNYQTQAEPGIRPKWLGLVVDNRQLFDALQDDWLRPPASETGWLMGVNGYRGALDHTEGNRMSIRACFDLARLPSVDVRVFRDGRWQQMPLSDVDDTDAALLWPGALPLFSTPALSVASEEQRIRLRSMAKRASNIDLPETTVNDASQTSSPPVAPPPAQETPTGILIPEAQDALRGAVSMALWAVPRIDPWLDLLSESLSAQPTKLREAAAAVDAGWWRFPPWARSVAANATSVQDRLWLAAVDVFASPDPARPREAADQIAAAASREGPLSEARTIEVWRVATHEILRAEAVVQHENWREQPVGLAIQLVLSRPEPTAFKTWFDRDSVDLPPAVTWSAAVLCGLRHGYRKLDTRFRGKQVQRELVAIQALRRCLGEAHLAWPDVSDDPPKWERRPDCFALSWGGRELVCKRWLDRGKWYAADLGVDATQREALAIANERGWRCRRSVIHLEEGARSISGSGSIMAHESQMKTRGTVQVDLLPSDRVEERLDAEAFRRLIAVESGCIPAPPTSEGHVEPYRGADAIPPGLKLIADFLTEAEEREILSEIDRAEWSTELQRRVQHYGWRYDYKSRQVDPSLRIGPLPDWAARVAERLVEHDYFKDRPPDQLIVNEYRKDQGISRHIDSPASFGDVVAMISLLETWEMEFRKRRSDTKVTHKLGRRSATILTGEARYEWTHEIPKRKTEPGPVKPGNKRPTRLPRDRRISLTFRTVNGPAVHDSKSDVR